MRKTELFTLARRIWRHAAALVLGAALSFANACHRRPPPPPPLPTVFSQPASTTDSIVAKVNGQPIYRSAVERQARVEGVSAQLALQSLVTLETLYQKAAARKMGAGPEARQGWRQILVQAYVEREIEPQLTIEKIPDAVLKEVYERGKDGYQHSRLVRIAILDLYAFANRDPERRRQASGWAKELAGAVKGKDTAEDLRALSSESTWSTRGLKYGVVWQSETQPYSAAVAKAVMRLQNWGETTPVIEDDAGFHLAMYIGERAPHDESFEQAKQELRTAILAPWQQRRFTEITQRLASEAGVTVTPEVLVRQGLK